jgi:hypothetical protein
VHIRGGGELMFLGKGGSAADAQHLATELTIRYKKSRAKQARLCGNGTYELTDFFGINPPIAKVRRARLSALALPQTIYRRRSRAEALFVAL